MSVLEEWRIILKLDPGRSLSEERLEQVCAWPVDAVVVGGSGGYGREEVSALLGRLRKFRLPVAMEISDTQALCAGFDLYLVPMVLNAGEVDWIVGHQHTALKEYGSLLQGHKVFGEGYCILNPGATASQMTAARTDLDTQDVVAFARLAQDLLRLPVFYMEYSGTYGSPELVAEVGGVLQSTLLWYGGGIRTPEQTGEMAGLANAIVIGNAVYEGDSPLQGR